MPSGTRTPRWSLDTVYTGYEDPEYQKDRRDFIRSVGKLAQAIDDRGTRKQSPEKWVSAVIRRLEKAYGLNANLESYIYCRYATNTRDSRTLGELNSLERDTLGLKSAQVRLRNELHGLRKHLPKLYKSSRKCERFKFYLDEQVQLRSRQMTAAEEDLASDLNRAGGDAWGRLQETIASNLAAQWSDSETKTVVELRALATHRDRAVREKAYRRELEAWKTMEIPLAAALNGVKGFAVTLDKRRHYGSSLERAAFVSRISDKTLEALVTTMEKNLGLFRRYLKAKAKFLGISRCAFFDLFAPVGDSATTWSFADARRFIVSQFGSFSSELSEFAASAFEGRWIDAVSRPGKVPGAFCTYMPLARESRILANFDGSFDSVATLAHELGHAYHGHVMKDLSPVHQDYPMTLAETASIFCEAIVFNRGMETAATDGERVGILELFLQGATAVIVDILSRFKFERAVFAERPERELSPAEFSELMLRAQVETYGDGLDPSRLHKYMWAVKGHYYSVDVSFYNYPYAFGQLLGLALYAAYEADREGFPETYRRLLLETGQATANEVTARAGFDIESTEFWQGGMEVIARRVAEFEELAGAVTG
jgi:pepF/M3 family oligoendopeptidase